MAVLDTYTENPVVIGGFPTFTMPRTIKAGQGVLPAGTVLGKIAADRKHVKSVAAAEDGSQTARTILAVETDTTNGDVVAPVYVAGCFNPAALIFGAGHDADTVGDDFDGTPMFLRRPVADGQP